MMPVSHFDVDLIRRYNVNGPRYTSYPTADQFRTGDWSGAYDAALAESTNPAFSLYFHIPFCSTICFYCACNKVNTANTKRADAYVQRLISEMSLQRERMNDEHRVEQLHFGGGTPTFLSDDQFHQLFESIHSSFNLADESIRDFSVEIDPRKLNPDRIATLAKLGINRLSIGVQDFDPIVQVAVNRVQSFEETRAVIDEARRHNIQSINIDLINGLPNQTIAGFGRTLEQVIALQPDRLSLYSYAHLPHRFKTQKQINSRDLPGAQAKLELLETAVEYLTSNDYLYVGMDHFAKASDSLIQARKQGTLHRNFQGYTTHGHCQLVGLGVSSIGNVGRVYVQNSRTLNDYYQSIDTGNLAIVRGFEASDYDVLIAQVIQDLMCKFEIDFSAFETAHDVRFRDYFSAQWSTLQDFESQGLLKLETDRLRVSDKGRYLVRNICMAFDEYLGQDTKKFSKAI